MEGNQIRLLFGGQGEMLCRRLFSLSSRFPKFFPKMILKEIGGFLSNCPDSFLETHDISLLCQILFSHHRLIEQAKISTSEGFGLKVLKINPSIFGLVICLSFQDQQILNEHQLLKGIQNLIPGIKQVPHSFLAFRHHTVDLFYLEIRKMRGGILTREEKEILNTKLRLELQQELQPPPHTFCFPGNEEELFKNIRHLSHELRYVKDLPQVMITCIEYVEERLKFLVIALRIIKPATPSIESLSQGLSTLVRFSLENVFYIDRLRNKYPKEATVFTLEVNSSLFLRNPHGGVNLRMARQYTVKTLESILGPFRDYNGGLLRKEEEQLLAIKRLLGKKDALFPFLEDLFYGIKPMTLRPLVNEEIGLGFAALFQKISEKPVEHPQTYYMESQVSQEVHLVLIKTKEKEWKNTLPHRILPLSLQIGCSCIEKEGFFYLCFFHLYPEKNTMIEAIQNELEHSCFVSQKQTVLNINFQAGDPPSLNPCFATDIHCHILSNLLFEGLTQFTQDGSTIPATAEKIIISPSRTSYTFYLRQSWWSNGEEVSAYHFEKAWKKALVKHATGRLYMDLFSPIKHAKKVRNRSTSIDQVGIVAKDAKTLCIELEAPCPHFLNLVATPPFSPLFGETEEPLHFNGPFTLSEWKRDEWLYLSKNPFYRDSYQVKLEGIKIWMIRDPYLAYKMFQEKQLDLVGDPISPLPPDILKSPDIQKQLHYKEASRIFWIHCNTHQFPLQNAHLRRALSLAIHRTHLTETVFIKQTPHSSPLPPKYSSLHEPIDSSVDQALFYFKKALEELKLDPTSFPPLVITHSDLSFEKELVQQLKTQWKATLGISVLSRQLPWDEFLAALERGNFQLGGLFRRDFFNNPMFYLSFFKMSPNNPHSWENEEYERLLEQVNKNENSQGSIEQIERLLIEQAPVIPLVNQRFLVLMNDRIKGVEWNENGCFDLKKVWINES